MIGMHFTGAITDIWPREVTHVRLWDAGVAWRDIHLAPGVYDWRRLDALVAKAGKRHITYVIGGTPRWAAKYPNQPHYAAWLGPGSNSMPFSVDVFAEFIRRLVTRYAGKIKAYEVWNEPQLAEFLYPYTAAECNVLASMTRRAYVTIKKRDPLALVLAASVLPRESSGGMRRARLYLGALRAKGWWVDGFTTHIYPEVGTWAVRWQSMLTDVEVSLAALQPPTRRLWVTETLLGLLGPELTNPTTLSKAVTAICGSGKPVYWYAWDRPDLGGSVIAEGKPTWKAILTANA